MVKEDNNSEVTAYISLVFIGLVLFILTVGCLCRMCRPVKKKLIVKVKRTNSSGPNFHVAPSGESKSGDIEAPTAETPLTSSS